ncbi:MAG: FHA domain-containing protein [Coriobacteriia bacterium]|nr:FHA domain-containing protein [Coriobacteriia bacterium]
MDRCPACGASVAAADEVCATCGARLEGATESFEVLAGVAEAHGVVDVDVTEVPVLIVHKGIEVGERFYLEQPRVAIGRDPESDIFLNDVTVSRAHAVLHVDGKVVRLEDVGSLNGTYVNDSIVADAVLNSGDTVQIGRFQMVYLSGGGA